MSNSAFTLNSRELAKVYAARERKHEWEIITPLVFRWLARFVHPLRLPPLSYESRWGWGSWAAEGE